VVWGGLASAFGMHGLALAIAVLTGAFALACTAVMACAAALGEETEADGDALGSTGGEPRQRYFLGRPESSPPSVRWN
jgi:hypothetical protein